jgi:Cu/Ag efflux pump CusA
MVESSANLTSLDRLPIDTPSGGHVALGITLGSLAGFFTVLGIAARNGILMISHFRHLEEEEGVPATG